MSLAAIELAYPSLITRENYKRDIVKLPGLGDKTLSKVELLAPQQNSLAYLALPFGRSRSLSRMVTSKKRVRRFRSFPRSLNIVTRTTGTTRASERFQTLSTFASIYGIGPTNARKLYDLGLRTVEHLERYYDVPAGSTIESIQAGMVQFTPNGKRIPISKAKLPDMAIKFALALREELDAPIPREEVEQMHRLVMKELHRVQPGCVSTIVGGLVYSYYTFVSFRK